MGRININDAPINFAGSVTGQQVVDCSCGFARNMEYFRAGR